MVTLSYIFSFRAVNNGLLDTYQLKSLDGLLEASVEEMVIEKRDGKLFVLFNQDQRLSQPPLPQENREEEDKNEIDQGNNDPTLTNSLKTQL